MTNRETWKRQLALACLALGGVCVGLPAQATAVWRSIAVDTGRSIEIDSASIQREADGKVLASGRMVLEKEIVDARTGEPYKVIQTLTRYDCTQRTATTVRRTFIKAQDQVLREEEVRTAAALPVRSGTLDYRILREVCRPPGNKGEAMKLAERATEAAEALRKSNEAMVRQQVAKTPVSVPPAKVTPKPVVPPAFAGYVRTPTPTRSRPAPARVEPAIAAKTPELPKTWAYTGPGGPEAWGRINPDYQLCAHGQRQSPIDIRDGIQVDLEPLQFDYRPSRFSVVDTGYGIEVRVGDNRVSLLGKSYELERIRFHRPAEERIDGQSFDMGVHLEHLSFDGERLVVAILLQRGMANELIQTLWNYIPLERQQVVQPPEAMIDLGQLLPTDRGYHTFMGSMTRPPCTEGVIWAVLQQPVQLSPEQEAIFARLYPDNARPTQPLNGRLIKSSRTPQLSP